MKDYYIYAEVKEIRRYCVEADSEKEALEEVNRSIDNYEDSDNLLEANVTHKVVKVEYE